VATTIAGVTSCVSVPNAGRSAAFPLFPALSEPSDGPGYLQADEPLERVRAAFGGEDFARLQALKSRLDPDNVLHRNQNSSWSLSGGSLRSLPAPILDSREVCATSRRCVPTRN
jgi:hypothetical protein